MRKLLKYDFLYLFKTSKFLVFGAIFVIFSIISPLTAKYLNEILAFLLNGQDFPIDFPDPTIITAYEQYINDLYEIIFIVTLFVAISVFIRDKTKNLQPLIFSKPICRTKYLLSKYISFLVLLLTSLVLGYLTFSYYTYFLFDEVYFEMGTYLMLLYFLDLMFVSSIALFCATFFKNYIGAMLMTWVMYIGFGIITVFDKVPVIKHFPGMIKANIGHIIYSIQDSGDVWLNVLVTLILTGIFIGFSIQKIRNQEV